MIPVRTLMRTLRTPRTLSFFNGRPQLNPGKHEGFWQRNLLADAADAHFSLWKEEKEKKEGERAHVESGKSGSAASTAFHTNDFNDLLRTAIKPADAHQRPKREE